MDELAARTGRRYGLVDYHGAPDADRVDRRDGLGRRRGRGDRRHARRRRREGRDAPRSACSSRSPPSRSSPPCRRPSDRSRSSTGPRSRARSASRSTSRSSRRSPRRWTATTPPFATAPRVIGGRYGLSSKEMTPSMIKPIFDELARGAAEAPLHGRHLRRRDAPQPADRRRRSGRRARPARSRRCSSASARTARSAPTRRRSRSSARAPTCSPRATSSTTPRSRARSRCRTCASGREPIRSTYLVEDADFVACHQFGLLGKTKVLEHAKHGRDVPAQRAVRPRRGLGAPARRRPAAARRQGDRLLGHRRRSPSPTRPGWAAGSTPSCSRASSSSPGVLPADEAIARIKAFVEKTYAKRGEAVVARNFAAIDRSLERLAPRRRWAASPTAGRRRRRSPDDVPGLRRPGHVAADGRRRRPAAGQRAAGRRHLPDRHGEVREAGDRPEDPDLGPVDLHRLRQVRDGLPARDDPDEGLPDGRGRAARRPTSCTRSSGRATSPDHRLTIQVAPDDCTGCGVCVDVCPAKSKTDSSHKAINMEPVAEHRDVERARWDFFQSIPPLDREPAAPRHGQGLARSSSRCSSSRAPAAAAARRRTSGSSASCSATG